MSQFQYKKTDATHFHYEYSCLVPEGCDNDCKSQIEEIDKKSCKNLTTPLNILGEELGKSTNYLDRYNVKCPPNFSLKGFRLERNSPKVNYRFTCCPARLEKCSVLTTKATSFKDYSTGELEKQNIVLKGKDQALTGFKLQVDYRTKSYSYKVNFCTITG